MPKFCGQGFRVTEFVTNPMNPNPYAGPSAFHDFSSLSEAIKFAKARMAAAILGGPLAPVLTKVIVSGNYTGVSVPSGSPCPPNQVSCVSQRRAEGVDLGNGLVTLNVSPWRHSGPCMAMVTR